MKIGYIGLGKMGSGMVSRLLEKGYEVVAFDPNAEAVKKISAGGAKGADSIAELFLFCPRRGRCG